MILLLMRHGIPVAPDALKYAGDDLPLSEQGQKQSQVAAKALKAMKLSPAAIFTSQITRAKETAEIVGKELGLSPQISKLFGPDTTPAQAIELMQANLNSSPLLLVGHEPGLCALFSALTGARSQRIFFDRSGVCCLECNSQISINDPQSVLLWHLNPAQMEKISA